MSCTTIFRQLQRSTQIKKNTNGLPDYRIGKKYFRRLCHLVEEPVGEDMSDMAARITIWWGGQFTQINRVVSLCFLLFSRPSRQAFRFCIVLLFATLRNSFYIVKYLKNGTKFMLRGGSQALYKTTEFVWLGMHGKVKRSWNGSLALFRGRRGEREREVNGRKTTSSRDYQLPSPFLALPDQKRSHNTYTHQEDFFLFSAPSQRF